MPKRTFAQIRKDILAVLSDGKIHSFGDLERKVNMNWETIRNQCQNLALFNVILIEDNKVKITKDGREVLKKMK